MYRLAKDQQQYQWSLCLHPMSELLLSCFWEHHYYCDSIFRRLNGWSICSIFPLYMESNALEKFTNKNVILTYFAWIPLEFDEFSESVVWIGFY